jgi:hypothetical protein
VQALIAEASQPVAVDLAVGVALSGGPADALAAAGLASAVPPRMAVVAIAAPSALDARERAEEALGAMGTGVIGALVDADLARPVGLWIPASGSHQAARVRGEIAGLNIERVLMAMGAPALDALEVIADSTGPASDRASALHRELSQLDVDILPGGVVRIEGETVATGQIAQAVRSHGLARSARVNAPGDLPLNQVIPVFDTLRSAGLSLDIQATSDAVVTISGQDSSE